MSETFFCLMCEADRPFRREMRREEYECRGEKIALDVPRLVCLTCGDSQVDEAYGDPTLKVYDEYRRQHGLPADVGPIRERLVEQQPRSVFTTDRFGTK